MRRLAVLSIFPPLSPPTGGGELRLLNLYGEISRRFRVDVVSWTYAEAPAETVRLAENLYSHRVPVIARLHELQARLRDRGLATWGFNAACAIAGLGRTAYHLEAARWSADADVVIHESPFTLLYDRSWRSDGKPRIYNSHNLEAEMALAYSDHPRLRDFVFRLERRLVGRAALVLATSELEKRKFECLYGAPPDRVRLCPNGFSPEEFAWAERAADARAEKAPGAGLTAAFIGSAHPPNLAAAHFILTRLAPAFQDTRFELAGAVCERFAGSFTPNVVMRGTLDGAGKRDLFERADIFLNPVTSGAGTSLKAIEAMAAALPVLTTELGVRGLELCVGSDAVVADLAQFPRELLRLLARPELRRDLGLAARRAVAGLAWPSIAARAADEIERVCEGGARSGLLRRVLRVTARPDEPDAEEPSPASAGLAVVKLSSDERETVGLAAGKSGGCAIKVPKSPAQQRFHERGAPVSTAVLEELAAALYVGENPTLTRLFRQLAMHAERVEIVSPGMLPLAGLARRRIVVAPGIELIPEAELRDHPDREILLPVIQALAAFAASVRSSARSGGGDPPDADRDSDRRAPG